MSQLSDDSASLARLKYQVVRADFMSITADFVDSKMYAYVWAEMFRDIWVRLRHPFLRRCSDIFSTSFVTLQLP